MGLLNLAGLFKSKKVRPKKLIKGRFFTVFDANRKEWKDKVIILEFQGRDIKQYHLVTKDMIEKFQNGECAIIEQIKLNIFSKEIIIDYTLINVSGVAYEQKVLEFAEDYSEEFLKAIKATM